MNGRQLTNLLSMDEITHDYFRGFAMQDSEVLPFVDESPAMYVLNTDKESGKGRHWCIALYHGKHKRICEFFDPFGFHPTKYGLGRLLKTKHFDECIYNPVCVQSLFSNTCGAHCVFFAFHRCYGVSMTNVMQLYDAENMHSNDEMVSKFVSQFGIAYAPERIEKYMYSMI